MILADLFTFAAQNWKPGKTVQVSANVTTNQTDGLHGPSSGDSVTGPPINLVYVPGHEIKPGFFSSPSFQSSQLTITAPRPRLRGGDPYWIEWQGYGSAAAVGFAAAVDGTTNIIYGAAGQQFVTIGLWKVEAY